MVDFLISVVCYNNETEILEFAKGLKKQTIYDKIKLLVTCNSCSNPSAFSAELKKEYEQSEVYVPPQNLGYLNGCLYGFQKQKEPYKWGLISNTDIEFTSEYFFKYILIYKDCDIWCIGPDIVLANSTIHQNPFCVNRPSTISKKIHDFIYTHYLIYSVYFFLHLCKKKFLRRSNSNISISKFVYAVHGSCFILAKDCIDAMIQENNKIFMYEEELFVAEVAQKYGKKIYFDSSIGIVHKENQTTKFVNLRIKQEWKKNSIEYLKSFYHN